MPESMGVMESPVSDHSSPEIHNKMSSQPLPLCDLINTSSLAQFEPTSNCKRKVISPWDKAHGAERALGAFSPLCSGDSRLLGSLFYHEGWWGKRKQRQNNLCDYELTDINLLALLGISPSHSTTELRVENTFPEKLFFSCAFCGEGDTIIEKKKGKNRRWKGQACTITASSAPAAFLNCTNVVSAWHHTGGDCQGAVEHTRAGTPTRNLQSQARSILRAGLCWAQLRRCRDTPNPTPAP